MLPTTPTAQQEKVPAEATSSRPNPYIDIANAARTADSYHTYYANVLRIVAQALASPCAAVSVQCGSSAIEHDYHSAAPTPAAGGTHAVDGTPAADGMPATSGAPRGERPESDTRSEFWMPAIQQFLTEALTRPGSKAQLLDLKDGDTKIALLAATLFDVSGEPIGAVALVTGRRGSLDAARKLTFLEALACFASYTSMRTDSPTQGRGPSTAGAAEATAHAGTCSSPEELAFAITNNLRNKLGCEQVALGIVDHKRIKVLSASGFDAVAKQSTGVRDLQGAMEECFDADKVIACSGAHAWSDGETGVQQMHRAEYRLHKQWQLAVNGDAVASIPLCVGEATVAVLSLRSKPDQPFSHDQIEKIRGQVEPFAPALLLLRSANRGLIRHGCDVVEGAVRAGTSRGHVGSKVAVLLMIVAAGWVGFATMDYKLTVPCVVRPQESRHVTAPFSAVLNAAGVVQGDPVKRGDILCQFDQRELEQRRAELNAELNVYEHEKDQAMAEDDPVRFQLAHANQKLSSARLGTLNMRIEQCTVRAPIDGLIVRGDLRKRIGSVFALGDPLFEIAPPHSLIVELAVPEADADDLAVNLTGTFAPRARPERSQPFRITRIHPRTETREQGNVCIVEATADLSEEWILPGMEGVARINVGRRRVWWVGIHRIVDYLRLKLWL